MVKLSLRVRDMSKKNIDKVIEGFEKLNLHFKTPKHTKEQIHEMEKKVGCSLPPDYKKTLLAGYIDKGTFHFLPLAKYEKDERFLVFGKWNDDTFLFDTSAQTNDYPVFVIAGHSAPEKCFDNFHDWLKTVLNAVNRANFPG